MSDNISPYPREGWVYGNAWFGESSRAYWFSPAMPRAEMAEYLAGCVEEMRDSAPAGWHLEAGEAA